MDLSFTRMKLSLRGKECYDSAFVCVLWVTIHPREPRFIMSAVQACVCRTCICMEPHQDRRARACELQIRAVACTTYTSVQPVQPVGPHSGSRIVTSPSWIGVIWPPYHTFNNTQTTYI